MIYDHRQPGHTMLIGIGCGCFISTALLLAFGGEEARKVLPFLFGFMGLLAFLFYNLRITVDINHVRAIFGPGLLRKTLMVPDISRAHPVRNKFWYGFGIKYTPHGWLYNVSGLDAVEIELKNGKHIRLGTDEPRALCAAIRKAIG